jgi:tetratricopeptide (TPR) repeat protein
MNPLRRCWTVLMASSFLAAPVYADTPPSPWDRAKSPEVARAWDLHARVTTQLSIAAESKASASERMEILGELRDELERAGAKTSPDVLLRFDLGRVYGEMEHYVAAIEVIEPALAVAPHHPAAESAWDTLATAHAKLDHSREEIRAYDAILGLTVDVSERARVLANRAEAEMRLGALDEAISGYREALALSESNTVPEMFEESVLAHWGLAVALDRSGDPQGALHEAGLAVSQDGLQILRQPYVFFVPHYEIKYYLALAATVLGDKALNPREGLEYRAAAEDLWEDFVQGAEDARDDCERQHPHNCAEDRWAKMAQSHLTRAKKDRAAAEKRAGAKRAPRRHLGREIKID